MKLWCAILVGMLAFRASAAEIVDGIEAVVHDAVVSRQDVESKTMEAWSVLLNQYGKQPELLRKKFEELQRENREQLVERQLILHEFKTAGYTLPESVLDELVAERIQRQGGDRMTLIKTLQSKGLTREKFRQTVRDQFIIEVLRQKNTKQEFIISPHKIETYYLAHKDEFKVDDEVKVRMIVVNNSSDPSAPSAQKLANEIASKLKEGATFEEMEKIYSQETARNQGGKWYERDQLTKGLADVAFSLEVGKCSGVLSRTPGDNQYWVCQYDNGKFVLAREYKVDSDTKKEMLVQEKKSEGDGAVPELPAPREYFVMKVEDRRAAHFRPLSEVRDQIEKAMTSEEQERLLKQWVQRLRKKTFVRYF